MGININFLDISCDISWYMQYQYQEYFLDILISYQVLYHVIYHVILDILPQTSPFIGHRGCMSCSCARRQTSDTSSHHRSSSRPAFFNDWLIPDDKLVYSRCRRTLRVARAGARGLHSVFPFLKVIFFFTRPRVRGLKQTSTLCQMREEAKRAWCRCGQL